MVTHRLAFHPLDKAVLQLRQYFEPLAEMSLKELLKSESHSKYCATCLQECDLSMLDDQPSVVTHLKELWVARVRVCVYSVYSLKEHS